ncbi:MAG: histone deacetylase [Methanoregulaceae archaeon]|nr:histone deacetylase [Methanoregulaceae archaeon]
MHDIGMHTESSVRLRNAISGIPNGIPVLPPGYASVRDLERVHRAQHVRMIRELSVCGGKHFIDMSTYVTQDSYEVACHAAGSAMLAVNRALLGEHSFALVRPPGHHAEPDRAMGFCLFNNAAVAAAYALQTVERVAIVDWDLHHGNGTQKIFYESDRVLYCSVHQVNIFPRTGWIDEIGEGRGKGFNLNAPIAAGCTIDDYAYVFREVFLQVIEEFRPDIVIVSAGQDPLFDDPVGGMNLRPEDFGILTRLLMDATPTPLALVLEGGYGQSLGPAIREIFTALLGHGKVSATGLPSPGTERVVDHLKRILV